MTKPLVTDEMMADILASDADGKDIKEGVAPETNMLPPDGEHTEEATETSLYETFEQVEEKVMHWAENPWFYAVVIPLVVWSLIWKGLGLWKAARNNQPRWFIAFLLVHTLGLLEIGYLKWAQKRPRA